MGIYDRDYTRAGRPTLQGVRGWTMTTRLIVVNGLLWFIYAGSLRWGGHGGGLYRFISDQLLLHPDDGFRIWQPFTAMFFHDPMGIGHVFFNMLFLFFFGRVVESLIGRRDYLKLYILGGAIAAFSLVPLAWLTGDPRPGLGASGAIYAIGVFAALRIPNLPVILLFVPMPLWVMVTVFMVGGEVLNLVLAGAGIGATVAHLTGAAVGWVYHRRHRARGPGRGASWMARFRKRVEQKRVEQSSASEDEVRARVDRLLEKINAEGIGSLDKAEKDFLQQASRRFQ